MPVEKWKGHLYENLPPSHSFLNRTKTIQQLLMVLHIMYLSINHLSPYDKETFTKGTRYYNSSYVSCGREFIVRETHNRIRELKNSYSNGPQDISCSTSSSKHGQLGYQMGILRPVSSPTSKSSEAGECTATPLPRIHMERKSLLSSTPNPLLLITALPCTAVKDPAPSPQPSSLQAWRAAVVSLKLSALLEEPNLFPQPLFAGQGLQP